MDSSLISKYPFIKAAFLIHWSRTKQPKKFTLTSLAQVVRHMVDAVNGVGDNTKCMNFLIEEFYGSKNFEKSKEILIDAGLYSRNNGFGTKLIYSEVNHRRQSNLPIPAIYRNFLLDNSKYPGLLQIKNFGNEGKKLTEDFFLFRRENQTILDQVLVIFGNQMIDSKIAIFAASMFFVMMSPETQALQLSRCILIQIAM
jgi:hypothetical protein